MLARIRPGCYCPQRSLLPVRLVNSYYTTEFLHYRTNFNGLYMAFSKSKALLFPTPNPIFEKAMMAFKYSREQLKSCSRNQSQKLRNSKLTRVD